MVRVGDGRPARCVQRLQLLAVLAGFLGSGALAAEPAERTRASRNDPRPEVAALHSREAQFQIPAQPLATALIAFSDQAHLQVISSGTEVAKGFAAEVRGRRRVLDAWRSCWKARICVTRC